MSHCAASERTRPRSRSETFSTERLREAAVVGTDRRFGVAQRPHELRALRRQLVGDVVPHPGGRADLDRAIEGRDRLGVLPEVQIGLAEQDVQGRILGRQRDRLLQLRNGGVVFLPVDIQASEGRVREGVERVDLELLAELGFRVRVPALLQIHEPQVVIGILVERIELDLLLEGGDRFVVLPEADMRASKLHPRRLVLRLELDDPLEQRDAPGQSCRRRAPRTRAC